MFENSLKTACLAKKRKPAIENSPMRHIQVSAPLDTLAIDIIGPLPVTVKEISIQWSFVIILVNRQRLMHFL